MCEWNGLIGPERNNTKETFRPSDSRDRNEREKILPRQPWTLNSYEFWESSVENSSRLGNIAARGIVLNYVITWDIYSNKKYILYKLYVCIFIPTFNRNAACHNMRNVWTVTYKFLKQHPPYRNAQTPTAPEQCSQPLLHSILPIALSTGFYHQEFQVPTMEVLNLIRLFWWWVFTYISLTYS